MPPVGFANVRVILRGNMLVQESCRDVCVPSREADRGQRPAEGRYVKT